MQWPSVGHLSTPRAIGEAHHVRDNIKGLQVYICEGADEQH
jgi:hypothetical protein